MDVDYLWIEAKVIPFRDIIIDRVVFKGNRQDIILTKTE